MNWLGHDGLRFIQTLMDKDQEKCKSSSGLFKVLSVKLKPQHNEMILVLQDCKLVREENETAKEWMGHLRIKTNECNTVVYHCAPVTLGVRPAIYAGPS